MKVLDFLQETQKEYNRRLPDSRCHAYLSQMLGTHIVISCYLSANSKECANGIINNDMLNLTYYIDLPKGLTVNDELPQEITFELWDNSYRIKPQNKYLAFSSQKLSFRKTKGTPEKILKTFGKNFDKLKEMLSSDLNNGLIHENHVTLLTEKLGC